MSPRQKKTEYQFKVSPRFRRNFHRLGSAEQAEARKAFSIFKEDPFDTRLRNHQIHRLSAVAGETVYSARVSGDLRVLFVIRGDVVMSINIGRHDIYK